MRIALEFLPGPAQKPINCLLNARPFAAARFAWLMPTQLHRPHHGIAEHRCEVCAPIPRDRWERRRQFLCPMFATGPSRHLAALQTLVAIGAWRTLASRPPG